MTQQFLPNTEIEIINAIDRGKIKHALFDFDGTISTLREGWQDIMAPVCEEMICGDSPITDEVRKAVEVMIDETTGIQTIFQMERLTEMVRDYGHVPEDQVCTPEAYKDIYIDRLMVPVRERIAQLQSGERSIEQATVKGVHHFLELFKNRGTTMYVFSGTDQPDVRNEAEILKAAPYFTEIWGAIPDVEAYSKEKVIRDIIAQHQLHGPEVVAIGDGPVELMNVKEQGCIAIGVASDEKQGYGWDMEKRDRLIKAGADIMIADYTDADALIDYLFQTS